MAPRDLSPKSPDSPRFTGQNVLVRDRGVTVLEVQRAADALLREGVKPSVVAIRERLGGGSPNTLTPILSRYWETLGDRLQSGPESLNHVPEALARVTELFWRRALEEARERLSGSNPQETNPTLEVQVMKLTTALAEARAREGEYLTQLSGLSRDRDVLRGEHSRLIAVLRSAQALLEQQTARVAHLEQARAVEHLSSTRAPRRISGPRRSSTSPKIRPRSTPKSVRKGPRLKSARKLK